MIQSPYHMREGFIPVAAAVHGLPPELDQVLETIGANTRQVSQAIPAGRKAQFSQYFTPLAIARQMAAMLDIPNGGVLGDAGAGTGILGHSALALNYCKPASANSQPYSLKAFEIDETLHAPFLANLSRVSGFAVAQGHQPPQVELETDFNAVAEELGGLFDTASHTLDAAILNPPYQKLPAQSPVAKYLKSRGLSAPNLYAVFMVLALEMLKPGGELVALVPRSFSNGLYFRSFRRWLRENSSIEWVVRFQSRSNLFKADNVLQENVIIKLRKGAPQAEKVRVTLCETAETKPLYEHLFDSKLMFGADLESIFMMPGSQQEVEAVQAMLNQPESLESLGLGFSTGKIEEHRYREHMHRGEEAGKSVPLLYAHNWDRGDEAVKWPIHHPRKPELLSQNESTINRILEPGTYLLLKRISANDDRTGRCHPAIVTHAQFADHEGFALENHVQYLHMDGKGITCQRLARGMMRYLQSDTVEMALRVISGTTQINKADFEALRFPSWAELVAAGS
ncbi:Eco57I restriction-modification methylase domain-containing protein [Neptuniibacter halophilus]|uniref:Eco57I restriction-modification methylase domain-containing protein n=1 Tax=Neptuniibacter halophilus TaxID=651666 RepID=UPI0025722FD3|nr:Eco57I restriction-modification methylase domain-containing protein [Neptuniibacter halophilus]